MPSKEVIDDDLKSITDLDRIIHEPARLMIMTHLYVVEEADFVFLIRQTGLTWGNLSSHLSKLEEAGYVIIKKEFIDKKPHTILKLTDKGRSAFKIYSQSMKNFMDKISK
jgi:DNA-binding MarR family transcriptional regulator